MERPVVGRIVLAAVFLLAILSAGWYVTERPSATPARGEALFAEHCQSCHLLPERADLPRSVWDTIVLPRMRALMSGDPEGSGVALPQTEWNAIREYVLAGAPDTLALSPRAYLPDENFRAEFPAVFSSPPSTSYLSVLPGGGLLQADINKESLWVYDRELTPVQRLTTGSGLTDLQTYRGVSYATVIGSFSPTDDGVGQLIRLRADGIDTLVAGLRRPTSLLVTDGDVNGYPEFIVCEYGKWSGSLRRYRRQPDGTYRGETLSPRLGPISVHRESDNSIIVLFGQGDECIVRFRRSADTYRAETLLRFPPSYGSSSLKVVDWNGDTYPDLLYTAGDLADYRSDPKPYHGVRIYIGRKDRGYDEAAFIGLPGAYGAEVGDFNGDGRMDVAAVSFFPDYRLPAPPTAVVYYGSAAGWDARFLPAAAAGRWLRLATGDLDGDGATDLVAGNLAMEPHPDHGQLNGWVKQGLPFIAWKNGGRHNTGR